MAVKIRLTRIGKKRQPSYRVVVADARSPRDGAYIEQIGRYDPRQEPSIVEIDNERASYWISQGAQPSSQVKKLLEISGAMQARPAKDPKIHVVGEDAQRAAAAGDSAVIAAAKAGAEKVVDMVEEAVGDVAEMADDASEVVEAAEEEA
jgi:small subunit ribosomal protein S16